MIVLVFLISLLSWAAGTAVPQLSCANQTNCNSCTEIHGCGWCAPTQQCLAGTAAGPGNSTCLGNAWEWNQCTPCKEYSDCRQCRNHGATCFWCEIGGGSCVPFGFAGCPYADACPCLNYASCTECTTDDACQWCSATGLCILYSPDTQCDPGPSYNSTSGCPCSMNQACSSCRQDYGCEWCQEGACAESCSTPAARSCSIWCSGVAGDCDDCNDFPGCGWCDTTSSCVDTGTSPCMVNQTCPSR